MPGNKKENQKKDYKAEEEVEIEIECTKREGRKMSSKHVFSEKQVIDSFKPELINMSHIDSFVVNIKEKSKQDQEILKKWAKSFQGYLPGVKKRVKFISPYIITKDPKTGIKTLWKENLII